MRIKKHPNQNDYVLTKNNLWVRNFTKDQVPYVNINRTIKEQDHFLYLKNEYYCEQERLPWIDAEKIYYERVIIISDGFNFKEKQKLLAKIPNNIALLGTNGALNKWQIPQRSLTYYVVNNPYEDCMAYLPRKNFNLPKCITSTRTNAKFLSHYRGLKYRYIPVNEEVYSGLSYKETEYRIDDYRNPICAALNLAYQFGAEKILLFCCDSVFNEDRPGAILLKNKKWMYPQQTTVNYLLDGMAYWLKNKAYGKVLVKDCSSGPEYENIEYIDEDNLLSFLE